MHELWPPKSQRGAGAHCLFHVVNIALNVVSTKRLAWQERKAESFTVTPRHCGSAYLGFRPSDEYGEPKGRRRHLAGHRGGDFRRGGEPEYGLSLLAVDDAIVGAVQRPARLVARQSRRARRKFLPNGRPEMVSQAAVLRSVRPDHGRKPLCLSVRRRPFRESRPLRDGAATLPFRRHRCRLRRPKIAL